MRIRVDSGSDIRITLADPGFGSGKTGIKAPSAGVTPPPPPPGGYTPLPTPASSGSMSFYGSADSNLLIPASADFYFEGNFTIEWWQKQTSPGSFPRIFALGVYPSTPLGVSLEGVLYFWVNNQPINLGSQGTVGTWCHHAIVRTSASVTHYLNGTGVGAYGVSGPIGSGLIDLRIANELTTSAGAAFEGQITNLHIVKGAAKYTSTFTPPTGPIPATTGTVLLLWNENPNTVSTDGSGSGRTVTVGNTAWSSDSPYA